LEGRLSWKSTLKKDGTKLGLCVSCFGVEVLVKAEGSDAPVAAAVIPVEEPTPEPARKPRKPRYPKHLQQSWEPSPN
jgi:hypothetical protein